MKNKITLLVDNKGEVPFIAEHGLAILIEISGKKILFDTGQGNALFYNCEKLGVSLDNLDAVVLSHGHYDHSGNIEKILSLNPLISFFAHKNCLISRWSLHSGKTPKSIGLSKNNKDAILNLSKNQIQWCSDPIGIFPGLWVTGSISRNNGFEDVGGPFYQDEAGVEKDLIFDDMAIWIEDDDWLTIICGCCHSGIKNTIEHIIAKSGITKINTIIGGLHLIHANDERLEKTISFLNKIYINKIIPAHCTGDNAVAMFLNQLSSTIQPGFIGLQKISF